MGAVRLLQELLLLEESDRALVSSMLRLAAASLSHMHAFLLKLEFLIHVLMTAVQWVGGVQLSWASSTEQL